MRHGPEPGGDLGGSRNGDVAPKPSEAQAIAKSLQASTPLRLRDSPK